MMLTDEEIEIVAKPFITNVGGHWENSPAIPDAADDCAEGATMSKTREALEAAKKFAWDLQQGTDDGVIADQCLDLLATLDAALAEPEQEPVAYLVTTEMQNGERKTFPVGGRYKDIQSLCDVGNPVPLYTSPPPRESLQFTNDSDRARIEWCISTLDG